MEFRNTFYQVLKYNNYNYGEIAQHILKCLDATNDNDLDVCIKLCTKTLEASQWNADFMYLEALKKWRLNKLFFDRIVVLIIKHLPVCPQFLNQPIFEIVKHLLCVSKKKRDFLVTLKEKMTNNKCWTQRRNFIQMYEYLYTHCSWQMMS